MIFDRLRDARRETVALFVDGPNLIRKEFDIDLDVFRERFEEEGSIRIAQVFLNQYAPEKLIEAIASQGFEPVIGVGETEGESSDVDVYMAVRAMEAIQDDRIDTVIIATRDADFLPLVQAAKEHGKRVIVAGHADGFSTALQNAADDVITI